MLDFLQRPASIRLRDRPLRRHTSLRIGDERFGVAIVENGRAKRLTLRMLAQERDGDLMKVTVPPGTDRDEIDDFLERQRDWIARQLASRPQRMPLADGASIPVRGVDTRIVHASRGRGATRLAERDGEPAILVFGEEEHLTRRVKDLLKKEARADLRRAVAHHASRLGVRPTSVTIRDTVSRWGSCSTTGALNFSWRIVCAPPEVLDYLAAHEVAHLREMNHSPRFWARVAETLPGYEEPRRWLKCNGARLHAIGS